LHKEQVETSEDAFANKKSDLIVLKNDAEKNPKMQEMKSVENERKGG